MEQQRDIVSNVMRVARKVRRLERPDRNESRGSLRLLRKLANHEGLTARELAEMMDIRQPSLTEMLNRLERGGIVRREPDQQDHRKIRIYLQDEGREILERYQEQRQQW
jgi:DNA-binding MarR family transcriptional regulator